jgi:hypothetical protein
MNEQRTGFKVTPSRAPGEVSWPGMNIDAVRRHHRRRAVLRLERQLLTRGSSAVVIAPTATRPLATPDAGGFATPTITTPRPTLTPTPALSASARLCKS